MKKLLAILTCLLLLCVSIPLGAISVVAATSGTTGDCTWTLIDTHLTISGEGAMGDYFWSSTLPWGTSITTVAIEDGVTTIGDYAFKKCDSLTAVAIPDSVTSIGDEAFQNCTSLKMVTIGDSVTTIGEMAFYNCTSLTSVTIPDSVTTMGNAVFDYCTSLESVTIGDGVTTIGEVAFYSCTSLTSVAIGNNVTTIGYQSFEFCTSLTSVTIGDSVTTIDSRAFFGCTSLESVIIPNSVTSIRWDAFDNCPSLRTIHYHGTTADKAVISIGFNNEELTSATWHYYDNGCDVECNDCGIAREPMHKYANACDRDCNACGATRVAPHAYDGVCDGECNLCGLARTAPHAYDTNCDTVCNGCGTTREPTHAYDDEYDADCNTCGWWREVPERPGDANGDGKVNNQDLGLLQQYLNEREVEIAVNHMDVDGNGRVNNMDLGILQRYLNGWDVTLTPVRPAVELPNTPYDVDGKGRIFVESVTLDGNTVTVRFTNRHKKWISDENAYLKYICTDAAGNVLTTGDKHYGFLRFGMLEVGASREMTFTLPEGTAKVEFGDAYIDYWTQWA